MNYELVVILTSLFFEILAAAYTNLVLHLIPWARGSYIIFVRSASGGEAGRAGFSHLSVQLYSRASIYLGIYAVGNYALAQYHLHHVGDLIRQ